MSCCDGSSFVIDARVIFEMATQTNPCVQCCNIHTQLDQSHSSKFVLKQIYIMQRSKMFCTFHFVHFGVISQLHAPQKFHDGGQIQKFLPSQPTCWKALCYMCLGGAATGATRLLGMLHLRRKYKSKRQKLKHLYVLELQWTSSSWASTSFNDNFLEFKCTVAIANHPSLASILNTQHHDQWRQMVPAAHVHSCQA